MRVLTTRQLIEIYMAGDDLDQTLASLILARKGGWMFENGAAK